MNFPKIRDVGWFWNFDKTGYTMDSDTITNIGLEIRGISTKTQMSLNVPYPGC